MGMNKIFGYITLFGVVSTFLLFLAIFIWAFNNDYVLYNFNVQAEALGNNSLISEQDLQNIEDAGNEHASLDFYFNYIWIGFGIIFFISSLFASYFSKEENIFVFLNNLFFGTQFALFLLGITMQLTNWVVTELIYGVIPAIEGSLPSVDWYVNYMGLITLVHILFCIGANRLYFKVQEFTKKKDMGEPDLELV
ncbi:MAG: hypothetical protein ACOCUD_04190 [Bacillota bacterium]